MKIATSDFDALLDVDARGKAWQVLLDPPRARLDRNDGTFCLVDLEAATHRELHPAARTYTSWALDEEPLEGLPPPYDRVWVDSRRRGRIELLAVEDPSRLGADSVEGSEWSGTFPADPKKRVRARVEVLDGVAEDLLETLWRRCTALDPGLAPWLGELLALPGTPVWLEVERDYHQGTVLRRFTITRREPVPVPEGGFGVPEGFREVPFDPAGYFELSFGRPPRRQEAESGRG
ncbi:MAG: hypothetical protein MI919_06980 [Holophagales bacterium]|nr:hypothetical protein [Holophagales bacterium]